MNETNDQLRSALRMPGRKLVEQAGATLDAIDEDKDDLAKAKLYGPADVKNVEDLVKRVNTGLGDRAVAEEEKQLLTQGEHDHYRTVKVDRRRLTRIAQRVLDKAGYRAFTASFDHSGTVAGLAEDVKKRLAIANQHAAEFAKKGAPQQMLDAMAANVEAMLLADGKQENAVGGLSAKSLDYAKAKLALYLAVKDANAAGQALWADEPASAARYNMRLLYRGRTRPAAATGATQAAK